MSTVPGHESWRDAGLATPELADVVTVDGEPLAADEPESPEEYAPADAIPAPDVDADEGDVVEQLIEVPADDQDDYR